MRAGQAVHRSRTSSAFAGPGGGSSGWSSQATSMRSARPSPSSRSATRSSASGLRRTRGVRLRPGEGRRGAQAGRHELTTKPRPSATACASRCPACGRRIVETGGAPRLRRLRLRRHGCGAARQALRRRRHGRVQHEEPRARAVARRRPRDRLHAGGLREERRDVRRRLRRRRQALVHAVARAR